LAIVSANTGLADDKMDYSGRYSLEGQTHKTGRKADSTLEVTQNEDRIKIIKVEPHKTTTSDCPVSGSDQDYRNLEGKCRAQLKGKKLIVESVVDTFSAPTHSPLRVHTKEQWELSTDNKTLTIKSDIDFITDFVDCPLWKSPACGVASSTSRTTKYKRIENP
jgi:hypothetical protein